MLAKRLFDLLAAITGLLLLAPLLLALAAWIRWDSGGPVLFRQLRVGRRGIPFHIYKFRTMRPGAQAQGQLSVADDNRATRAGRVLRRLKLDELPQLFNVARGDMSLVGPRPEVPRYVACYPVAVRERVLSLRPGVTDWAALRFRHEGDILARAADPEHAYLQQVLPVKLRYYQHYVRTRSFGGDLRILFCTVGVLLGLPGRRARAPTMATAASNASAPQPPSIRWLGASRLAAQESQSVLITLLRGLAALQVAAAHLRAQAFPGLSTVSDAPLWYLGLSFFTGFAHQAVVVFFLISGWLVGGALLDRIGRPHALRDYAIDRITRLWMVLLPAFALMLLLVWAGAIVPADSNAAANADSWRLSTALGNLVGLQTMLVPVFGANFPLWSLAYESWYYVLWALLLVSLRAGAAPMRLICAAAALVLALCLSTDIVLYFLVWLLGMAAARLRLTLPPWQQWLCWGVFGALAVLLRLRGQDGDFNHLSLGPDLLYSVLFLVCLCSMKTLGPVAPLLARCSTFLASFSFTLYVLHIPLQRMLWTYRDGAQLSPHDPTSLAVYGAMLAVVVALAYLFHLPFEAQTTRLRQAIRQRLQRQKDAAGNTKAPYL
ncbi:MAG: sugar transferase [Duganella sp.]